MLVAFLIWLLRPPAVLASTAEKPVPKRILAIFAFRQGLPWTYHVEQGMRTAFASEFAFPVELDVEHADRSRFPEEAYLDELVELYTYKYTRRKMDLVIAIGGKAPELLLACGADLFGDIPVILISSNPQFLLNELKTLNVTPLLMGFDIQKTVQIIQDVRPQTRNLFVVSGVSKGDENLYKRTMRALRENAAVLKIETLKDFAIGNLLERVRNLPEDSAILFTSCFRDAVGQSFVPRDLLSRISKTANAPIFGVMDTYLGHGIVGGSLLSAEYQGKRLANIGINLLKGEQINAADATTKANQSMFDWQQLKRWDITEKSLPPGSVVKYRKVSVWGHYKWHLTGITLFCILETLLIIALLTNLRRRRRSEAELSHSELRYRTVATSANDWVYWQNSDGTLRYVSPSAETVTGYTDCEFTENPALIRKIVVPEDRDSWDAHCREEFQESASSEILFRICRKDGRIRWIDHRCMRVMGPDGKSWGLRAADRDITERKQMEGQLEDRLHEIEELKAKLEMENIYLREEVVLKHSHEEIVGKSEAMKSVLSKVEQVAPTLSSVLLLGETGTGKDLLAQAIHNLSTRKYRAFVTVSCASLPPSLIESELFGREKGAFTGALTRMAGRFEYADGSTLFLDEIGEMPFELQGKLLQVLETGQFQRLGSSKTIQCDVRLIAATNRDLSRMVDDGTFRQDLYYRLNVFPIFIPPLRERPEDIPPLVWAFVREFEKKLGKRIETIPKKSMEALLSYSWPGNAREVRNMIEHAMILNLDTTLRVFPPSEEALPENQVTSRLEDVERKHILDVLKKTDWRIAGKGGAAEILGMKRSTLQSKMKKLDISRPV